MNEKNHVTLVKSLTEDPGAMPNSICLSQQDYIDLVNKAYSDKPLYDGVVRESWDDKLFVLRNPITGKWSNNKGVNYGNDSYISDWMNKSGGFEEYHAN